MPGEELLREGAESGDVQKIRGALKQGIDVNTNIGDGGSHAGYRAVHWATAKGHLGILEILVKEYKANINIKNLAGRTPLHTAIHRYADKPSKGIQVVTKLLELGANPNESSDGYQIFFFTYYKKQTPLYEAIEYWSADKNLDEVICLLLQYGAKPDVRDEENRTFIDLAEKKVNSLNIFSVFMKAADALYIQQKFYQAIECYNQLIEFNSNDNSLFGLAIQATFYFERGKIRVTLNEWRFAEEDLRTAIKNYLKSGYKGQLGELLIKYSDCLNKLGDVYYVQGKYSDAEDCYYQAVKQDSQNVVFRMNLSKAYFSQGKNKFLKAKKHLKKVLQTKKSLDALIMLGKIYFSEENFYKAIEKLQAAVDKQPKCTECLFELAESYYEVDNYKRAYECYVAWYDSHGDDFNPDIPSMLCVADSLFNLQEFKLAEGWFQLVLDRDSENYDALIGMADALKQQAQYSEALKIYQQLLQVKTNDSDALGGIGRIHYLQGNYREALNYLRRAYVFDKNDLLIYKWLIEVEKVMGNIERVVALYEERDNNFLEGSPDNSPAPGNNLHPPSLHEILDSYCENKKKFDFEAFEKLFFEALQAGADVAEKDKQGNTLLHRAIILRQPKFVKLMLQQPIDPNLPNGEFKKPLDLTIEIADLLVLKILLSCQSLQIKTYDKSGYMPLHRVAESGNLEVMQLLVDSKVEIGALTEKEQYSALYLALLNKHHEMAGWFLENGANPDVKCLRIAFSRNDEKMFRLLLRRGASLLEFSDQSQLQSTIFHLAAEENDFRKFEKFFSDILQHIAITIEDLGKILAIKNKQEKTALEIIINQTSLIDRELFKWIDAFAVLGEKIVFRYLEVAVQKKHFRLLENLFQRTSKVEIFKTNANQQNLFHLAVMHGADESILNLINSQIMGDIEREVLLNAGDKEGDSPLFLSIKNENSVGLRWLLKQTVVKINRDNGADFGRQSALHIAVTMGNEEVVSLLCQRSDINFYAFDIKGNSPLFFSKDNKVIRKSLKKKSFDQFWLTLSLNIEINLDEKFKKYLSLFLERLRRVLENKSDRLAKLQNTIVNYPPEKTNKIAKELGAELAKSFNKNLSAKEFFKKFNIACQLKQNYQFIDDFLEENTIAIFIRLDSGVPKNVKENSVERSEMIRKFKKKAFEHAIEEGLRYQFYISKALFEDKVDRKTDKLDTLSDVSKDISPLVQRHFGDNFNSAIVLTLLNVFASVVKSWRDENERKKALYVIESFGNGFQEIDRDKIKGVAKQLYVRFENLINQQSVGLDSCDRLRETPDDGVIQFAWVIVQRINAYILRNENKAELNNSSAAVNLVRSMAGGAFKAVEKGFSSPQNKSVQSQNLPLVRHCIHATWSETEVGSHVVVKQDTKNSGEYNSVNADILLRNTAIRITDKPDNLWVHANTQKEYGHIYATEKEAIDRGYEFLEIVSAVDDNSEHTLTLNK